MAFSGKYIIGPIVGQIQRCHQFVALNQTGE